MSGDRGHEVRRPSERAVDPDLVDGDVPADLDEASSGASSRKPTQTLASNQSTTQTAVLASA
jgi:hypothetical protein